MPSTSSTTGRKLTPPRKSGAPAPRLVRHAVTMATVDLVVTDLDGTLWFGHEETHPASRSPTWRELERRGIPVLVATGRRVTSTRNPLARLGFAPPAVMLNGAIAIDLATGERFHSHQYTADDASRVLAAFRAVGVEPCVYVDHPTRRRVRRRTPVDASGSPRRRSAPPRSEPISTRSSRGAGADVRDHGPRIASRSQVDRTRSRTRPRRTSRAPTSTAGIALHRHTDRAVEVERRARLLRPRRPRPGSACSRSATVRTTTSSSREPRSRSPRPTDRRPCSASPTTSSASPRDGGWAEILQLV